LADNRVYRSVALSIILPDMRISDQALNEFIKLYKEEFGDDLGRAEATEMAHRTLALHRLLTRKPPNTSMANLEVTPPAQG
jgi:hypothetical protein